MSSNLNLKVEDIVYSLKKDRKIFSLTIIDITTNINGDIVYLCNESRQFTAKNIGKNIFIKKEDAENLLKKLYSGLLINP